MKKVLALLGAVGMVAFLSGCGLTNPSSNVDISISSVGAVIAGGAAGQVEGKIEADSNITSVEIKVLNASDADVTADFTISFTSGYSGKKKADLKDDMSTTVAAKAGTAAGTYKLQITASAGSITSTSTKTFTVTAGSGTPVTTYTLVAGANSNATLGSSIDLDEPKVMLMAEAGNNVSKIDLCYAYSTTGSVEKLFSPTQAKLSGYTFAAGWASPNATKFAKLTMTVAEYNAITTREQILALTQPTTDGASIACAADDVFIAITDQNAVVLILITGQTAGAAGSINLKIAK
jgi:hypothetical protein